MTLLHVAYRIKIPYPLEWGAPTFDAGHAFGMMAAVLVSLIEVFYIFTKGVLVTHFTSLLLVKIYWKLHVSETY